MQKRANEDSKSVPAAYSLPADLGAYRIADPEAFGRNMLLLMEEGAKALQGFLDPSRTTPSLSFVEWNEATRLFSAVAEPWLAQPARLVEAQGALFAGYMQLMANTSQRMLGAEVSPVIHPDPGDSRFKDPEWSRNPYFDFCKQAYLITSRWLEDMLANTEGLDERTRQRAIFILKQIVTAFSPTNFPLTNPVVLRETAASSGQNLVQGMAN